MYAYISLPRSRDAFLPIIMTDADKTIYDRATGRALQTVKAHAQPKDLQCFFAWFCPYVFIIWLSLILGSTSVDCARGEER